MDSGLSLSSFTKIDDLLEKDHFYGLGILDLLGSALQSWLDKLLSAKGLLGTDPLINGQVAAQSYISGRVYVAEGASVEPFSYIKGPCYIGPGAEIRHGAYIRGTCYIGAHAVVGHTTEAKGSVFLDHAKAGHFAYVGDSILGQHVNLGAGTKCANLKLSGQEVRLRHPLTHKAFPTGLRKLGAILGDRSQTGCNAVLSPGTILCPGHIVMPAIHVHGTLGQL